MQPLRIVKKCSKGSCTHEALGLLKQGASHVSSSFLFGSSLDFNDRNKWLQLKPDLTNEVSHGALIIIYTVEIEKEIRATSSKYVGL